MRTRREFLGYGAAAAQLAVTPNDRPSHHWTVFLVNHSHIDVDYTERQEIIADCHSQFVRQALGFALSPAQRDRVRRLPNSQRTRIVRQEPEKDVSEGLLKAASAAGTLSSRSVGYNGPRTGEAT